MVTCNNCGENNLDAATSCKRCNMKNNFSPAATPQKKEEVTVLQSSIPCNNCGASMARHLKKCTHCRFPNIKQMVKKDKEIFNRINTLKKTG